MRCPDCSKFVSLELGDPEDVELEVDTDSTLDEDGDLSASVSMSCRIVRTCAECSTELKEASLEVNGEEITIDAETLLKTCTHKDVGTHKWREGHGEVSIEETSTDQLEEGGGRYAKSYFGATIGYEIKCKCGETLHEGTIEDKVAASHMEEMV